MKGESKHPKPPTMVHITDGDGERNVPLVDVDAVLQEHLKTYPIELQHTEGALKFKVIPFEEISRIMAKYHAWLEQEGRVGFDRWRLLDEKRKANVELTEEEKKWQIDFSVKAHPFSSEITHAMLHEPDIPLEKWRPFIRKIDPRDWERIYALCLRIMEETYPTPKN